MFENLDLFKTSHAMARHAGQRQALVARNVANADTPGFEPRDLTPFKSQMQASTRMKATRHTHLNGAQAGYAAQVVTVRDGAMSPNGNGVSVEDELLRAVDVKRQHDRALAVYRHTLTVLRNSLGRK